MSGRAAEPAWLACHGSGKPPRARVFWFAHAGANPAALAAWRPHVDPSAELCVVHLPGRGARRHERCPPSLARLSAVVARVVAARADLPFLFFGHSLGAMLAYQTAAVLRRRSLPGPAHLVLSGSAAPARRGEIARPPTGTDAELLAFIELLGGVPRFLLRHPAWLADGLPVLRADLALANSARYPGPAGLAVPMTVLAGRADPFCPPALMAGWERETSAACTVHLYEGGHFFLDAQRAAVAGHVNAALAALRQ